MCSSLLRTAVMDFFFCEVSNRTKKSTLPVVLWVNLGFILLKFVLPEILYSLSYVRCVQSARYKCQNWYSCFHTAALCVGKSNMNNAMAAVGTSEGVCMLVAHLRKIRTYLR
jgi:hypothetical protein